MDTLLQDLRFGVRMLAKKPAFTAMVVAVLALGIGANTALFSVVDAVLLRPLPYPAPERLVRLWGTQLPAREDDNPLSINQAFEYKRRGDFMAGFAALSWGSAALTGAGEPVQVRAARVMDGFFDVLGLPPVAGRTFLPEEDRPGHDGVAVLSYGLWQRRFAGDPRVVGSTVQVEGRSRTVVGVMPPGVAYPPGVDLWLPMALEESQLTPETMLSHGLAALARRPAGMSPEEFQQRADAMVQSLADTYPDDVSERDGALLMPLREVLVGRVEPALVALSAAVGFLLLLASANVANLLLARGEARQGEMAVRTVLGGGRGRLLRQLLTESLLLALGGGAVGLVLTAWGLDALVALMPTGIARADEVQVSGGVLLFALALSTLTGLLCGIAPALQLSRGRLHEAIKEGGRGGEATRKSLVRGALVVAEVALVLILSAGAGLMGKSFWHLLRVDPGVDSSHLLTFELQLPASRYPGEGEVTGFYDQLLARLQTLPGVRSAGAVSWLPFASFPSNWTIEFEGGRPYQEDRTPLPDYALTSGDYFEAMGLPLVAGRLLRPEDRSPAAPGVVITATAARLFWPGQDPLGRRIRLDTDPVWRTVVGIVGDYKNRGLESPPRPGIYLPQTEIRTGSPFLPREMAVTVRTAGDPLALAAAAREAVWALDPQLPVGRLRTMETVLADTVAQPRFTLLLLVAFAAVGLALGAVGIYGVVSFTAARRTREIGIRMALGARADDVVRLVMGRGLALAVAGLGLGLLGAWWMSRTLMATLLFEVQPQDPATLVAVSLLVVAMTALASLLPARRATRVDPVLALRE
jgi:putative ABC transport system permease protein